MALYKTLDINMTHELGGINKIQTNAPIKTEGVYYTYFIYEEVPEADSGEQDQDKIDNPKDT